MEAIHMRPEKLTQSDVQSRLQKLSGWSLNAQGEITRTFELKTFAHAMLFVNTVAHLAEQLDHHPDIQISYRKVTFTLSTHSAGGLTALDFELADKISRHA